jgi:hypothetical protein
MTKEQRKQNLMPNGIPRYVRVYDNNGKTCDRYIIVFSGHYRKKGEQFIIASSSEMPYNPTGVYLHDFTDDLIDFPSYSHLGKKIKFTDLPADVQKAVLKDYKDIWQI